MSEFRYGDEAPTRKPPRGRFKDVKVGDWLEVRRRWTEDGRLRESSPWRYLVTDAWFDPVEGQEEPAKGELFAVQHLRGVLIDGTPMWGRKYAHTRRGLASNGFHYAEDPLPGLRARMAGWKDGTVVPIHEARMRRRGAA